MVLMLRYRRRSIATSAVSSGDVRASEQRPIGRPPTGADQVSGRDWTTLPRPDPERCYEAAESDRNDKKPPTSATTMPTTSKAS